MAERTPQEQLRGHVSSDIACLQSLHEVHGWTPSSESIRPSPETMAKKALLLERLKRFYRSPVDYIFEEIFGLESDMDDAGRLFVPALKADADLRVLAPQGFPYDLPEGTNHSVMWYTKRPQGEQIEHIIEADIVEHLERHLKHTDFQFICYENPKMTIPEIYHVQVFWRTVLR